MALQWPFAANLYGFNNGVFGYLIPKPKFLFYVDFIINQTYQLGPNDPTRLGYIVKNVERPKYQYKMQEVDQYNRKRLFYTKVEYPNISMTFHDTVDAVVSKMVDDNNRMNFGDFSNMLTGDGNNTAQAYWKNNAIQGNDMRYWGYRLKNPNNWMVSLANRNFPSAENYFQEVRIYEFYGNTFTQFSLMNPKIESVTYDSNDSSSSDGNEITLTLNPEGLIYNYINAPIELSSVASSIMPGTGFTTDNFPISQINPLSSLVGAVVSAGGGLLTNLVDGIFGSFGSLNNTAGISAGVGVVGGTALAAASAGYFGPALSNSVTPQNLFFADSFLSTASIQQNNVLGANTLQGIQTITGFGANSIALGTTSNNLGAQRAINNISSLI